ncbi:MAG: AbrB/MazE/SpoVT family DNA-binding domain-containing protein [Myxococcales bacterium]|nr:AbrB/MazE/SpoVT family DNA-binding domain-containing protein [Myxococcales bacterium]
MHVATVTSKGQVTVPKPVRTRLGLAAGSQLRFRVNQAGETVVEVQPVDLMSLCGVIRWDGAPVSLQDMDDAIAASAVEKVQQTSETDS